MSRPEPGAFRFERLASFENLYDAARKARRGKRTKPAVARFHHDLAGNLIRLRDELLNGSYMPGGYHTFQIYEPAHRFISAAPYRDRVVHHALCNVIEPLTSMCSRGTSGCFFRRAGGCRDKIGFRCPIP